MKDFVNRQGLREAYLDVRQISYPPRPRMWVCPECDRLHWACEDLGAKGDVEGHSGAAQDRGQEEPPKCRRHPGVPMRLK